MWIDFLLGRPGYEYTFEVPPEAMQITEGAVRATHQNLAGNTRKSFLKTSVPLIKLNSSYLTLTQRNQFASLVGVQDTFLSFQCRDDFQVVSERNLTTDASHVTIQNTSMSRLSAALVAAGFPGIITINSVSQVPNVVAGNTFGGGGFGDLGFDGPDFFAGGSYDDATRVVTLGTALDSVDPVQYVFVTYTYTGWLVDLKQFNHMVQGGWLDRFQYDFQLVGA